MNLPTKLTLARVLAVPVIIVLLHYPNKTTCLIAAAFFIAASLTDLLDGLLARRGGQVTNFGKFLDPLADKILTGSVMIMLVELGWAPAWVVIVIIARETTVTGLRAMAADVGMVLAADRYGKIKTILQIAALIGLLIHYPLWGLPMHLIGLALLYLALVMTVFSGVNYLYSFYKNWLNGLEKGT
jgi:CDP-diacylglycerol--glycerol-3-phosphate 3-phosphatidyltransferase